MEHLTPQLENITVKVLFVNALDQWSNSIHKALVRFLGCVFKISKRTVQLDLKETKASEGKAIESKDVKHILLPPL
jgi:hypothetical protein